MRQIVDRLGALLALYSFERPEWGVTEAARRLGLAKSTVSELLASLAAQGFVERTPGGRYRLGWRLFELNHVLLESKPLVREARLAMQELVERHGESSHLMVLDRHQAVIVEKVQATLATQILMSRAGLRMPAHCSACGKLLLAWQPWSAVAEMFDHVELIAFTPATITRLSALADELAAIRAAGVAFDREEYMPGLTCVAAPIRDDSGEPVAGISITVPTYRFATPEVDPVRLITQAAERVSRRLGYRGLSSAPRAASATATSPSRRDDRGAPQRP
ncbi:MAG: IclR family transcriptional regulator [Betaproteobacteria bacterium]|nr:IclR family transcriptional regulator [Betaproteobacteria bacterium]